MKMGTKFQKLHDLLKQRKADMEEGLESAHDRKEKKEIEEIHLRKSELNHVLGMMKALKEIDE